MLRTRQIVARLNQRVDLLETLPQKVVAYQRDLASGEILPFHHHRRAQLVYASRGVMAVTTRYAAYVVPPQRAVWMPAGIEHRIEARNEVAMRTLYIEPAVVDNLPVDVCVLQVSPLLRELIITAAATADPYYEPDSPLSRIIAVILDQISIQPVVSLALPMPTEPRLMKIAQALINDPADARDLDAWAKTAGASKRTIGRLFTAQTGLSFQAWRQQCRLLRAMELLATGHSVTRIALDLGYDNTSAFIAMFRRCLGVTPKRYLNSIGQTE